MKTGFGFAKLAGFTGFPVLAKTGFHSLARKTAGLGRNNYGPNSAVPKWAFSFLCQNFVYICASYDIIVFTTAVSIIKCRT